MHFVSAHFGGKPPWFHNPWSKSIKVSNAYYTDKNMPSRHNVMHPRLKAKIPKMLEWQFIESDWYVWLDSSVKLKNVDIPQKILDCADGKKMCFFKHSASSSIRIEALQVRLMLEAKDDYICTRYKGEPILEQVIHYHGDPKFKDDFLLAGTFFAYHKSMAPVLLDWFNHNVTWSIQDQLSLPYVLQKNNVDFAIIPGHVGGIGEHENEILDWHWRERDEC